jgi:hypothetical protein
MALSRRRNQLLLVSLVLVAGCGDASQQRAPGGPDRAPSASPVASPSASPSTSASASPGASLAGSGPSPSPTAKGLELRGDDLAATRIGDPKADAVAAVERHLGPGDTSPDAVSCVSGHSEVDWPDLRLSFDADDRLNGWAVSTSRLATPSGVRVGTTVAELKRIYGDSLQLYPTNPDHGLTYGVTGVDILGHLDGNSDDSRVTSLANGACTGP